MAPGVARTPLGLRGCYSFCMVDRSPYRLLLWMLCLVVLCAQLGDVHLHLCLDDQQTLVSLQAGGRSHGDVRHSDPAHNDEDVSLIKSALTSLAKLAIDLPTTLAVFWLVLSSRLAGQVPLTFGHPHKSFVWFCFPPLRGPPRFSC